MKFYPRENVALHVTYNNGDVTCLIRDQKFKVNKIGHFVAKLLCLG